MKVSLLTQRPKHVGHHFCNFLRVGSDPMLSGVMPPPVIGGGEGLGTEGAWKVLDAKMLGLNMVHQCRPIFICIPANCTIPEFIWEGALQIGIVFI